MRKLRRKKNFLPAFFLTILFWFLVGFFIIFVDPQVIRDFPLPGSYLPFFIILFLALLLTLTIILSNTRRGFLLSTGIIAFLYLQLFGLGHIVNLILISAFLVAIEFALYRK